VLAVVALLAAGCQSGGSHAAAQSSLKAIATNSQVAADESAAEKNIIQPCLSSIKLAQVKSCIEGKVPPAARNQLKSCLAQSAARDKVWTQDGRHLWDTVSLNQCVAAAIPSASPGGKGNPKPSPSPSPSTTAAGK
jgi:hypothetical protein